jgi:CRP/FNR family cyclic AMP-dependent transcriptional regulator
MKRGNALRTPYDLGEVSEFEKAETIYLQGDIANAVFYVQKGRVQLSVSRGDKQAVVAILGAGSFIGEKCLIGRPVRSETATAAEQTRVFAIAKDKMLGVIETKHPLAKLFVAHLLTRNLRCEEDLVDSLCSLGERRLARVLILLTDFDGKADAAFPQLSQTTLAGMVGVTRSRVSFLMNSFKKRGFVVYPSSLRSGNGLIKVNIPRLMDLLNK